MATQASRSPRARKSAAAAAQPAVEQLTTDTPVVEAVATEISTEPVMTEPDVSAIAKREEAGLAVLPPMNERAINDVTPEISYKTPRFLEATKSWMRSYDQGATSEEAGTLSIGGQLVDLRLTVSEAKWKENWFDYRLSLLFWENGVLAETNINAINPSREDPNVMVMTGAARSLLGGLLVASQSEDDMLALRAGMRLTLKPGNKGSAFIDLDAVHMDPDSQPRWVKVGGPQATRDVPQGVQGMIATIELIRRRMVPAGVLLPGPGIYGEIPEEHASSEVIDTTAQAV